MTSEDVGRLPGQRLQHAGVGSGLGWARGRQERRVVGGLHMERTDDHARGDDHQLGDHRNPQHAERHAGAEDDHEHQEHDDPGRDEVAARLEAGVVLPAGWQDYAEVVEGRDRVLGPDPGHHRDGQQQLEQQGPADQPTPDLTEDDVGECVGTARHRQDGSELRVAKPGRQARERGDAEREQDGQVRPSRRPAARRERRSPRRSSRRARARPGLRVRTRRADGAARPRAVRAPSAPAVGGRWCYGSGHPGTSEILLGVPLTLAGEITAHKSRGRCRHVSAASGARRVRPCPDR